MTVLSDNQEKVDFLTEITRRAKAREAAQALKEKKRQALESVTASLNVKDDKTGEAPRDTLRRVMNFSVQTQSGETLSAMAPTGQKDSLEAADARKYRSLSIEESPAITMAMAKVVEMKEQLAKAGLSADEIRRELFEPLIREGLLPDTLVIDEYSPTARLLKAATTAYKETLEEARKERLATSVQTDMNFHGAGTKTDRLKAVGGKALEKADQFVDNLHVPVVGLKIPGSREEKTRIMKELVSVGYAVYSDYKAISSIQSVVSGDAMAKAVKELAEEAGQQQEAVDKSTLFASWGAKLGETGEEFGAKLDELADWVTLSRAGKITTGSLNVAAEVAKLSGQEMLAGLDVAKQKKIVDSYRAALQETETLKAAIRLVERIDEQIVASLAAFAGPATGNALTGVFPKKANPRAITEKARPGEDDPPDVDGIVDSLADALARTVQDAALDDDMSAALKPCASKIAGDFKSRVDRKAIAEKLRSDLPGTAFDGVEEAVFAVLSGVLPASSGPDGPEQRDDSLAQLRDKLSDPSVVEAMHTKLRAAEENEIFEDVQRSADEIAELERQLVLVDQGGDFMAKQQSMEKLIAQLKQDRKVLQMVTTIGAGLEGLGAGGLDIAVAAGQAAASEVIPFYKTAQLIIKFAGQVVKAAERWRLWNTFRVQADRALRAGSPLTPAIQGFYNNKKEQIAFATIQDALTVIKIAASVCESVKEPISLVVGKTMSAVASAAGASAKAANAVYDEVLLRRAWSVTKNALNNPANRRAGLQALQLNATLAMHAVAFAAFTDRDPIAKGFLSACRVDEQSLAGRGTTEQKIREYLTTLLNEDRQLLDPEQIRVNWLPPRLELSRACWTIVMKRGLKASPPLRQDDLPGVNDALRQHDKQTEPKEFESKLDATPLEESVRIAGAYLTESEALVKALNAFQPKTDDGSPHDDMQGALLQFINLADQRRQEWARILGELHARLPAG